MNSAEFKRQQRIDFRLLVLQRDGKSCRVCGTDRPEARVDVHQITRRESMPHGGYVLANGIALCGRGSNGLLSCREKAELASRTESIERGDQMWPFLPQQLYALVSSSHERALRSDERASKAEPSQRYVQRPEQRAKTWRSRRFG